MAQTIITPKSLEVDTDLQKIGMDMITMLRAAKKEGETKNQLNEDFSQDNNNVKKRKKQKQEL